MRTGLKVATFSVLVACFMVITSLLLAIDNMHNILTEWGDSMQVSVYLEESATDSQLTMIQNWLENNKLIQNVKLVGKEKAIDQFKEQMASYAPDLLADADLLKFIPRSFQFAASAALNPGEQAHVISEVVSTLRTQAGVEEVSYGQEWLKTYGSITKVISKISGVLLIVVLIAAGFVIGTTMLRDVEDKREEIEVLELVGATSSFIRGPFILRGFYWGAGAALLALLFTYSGYSVLIDYLKANLSFFRWADTSHFLSWIQVLALVVGGGLLGALVSWICVRRINSGWAARKFAEVE